MGATAATDGGTRYAGDAFTSEFLTLELPRPEWAQRAATPWALLAIGVVDTAGSTLAMLRVAGHVRALGADDTALGTLAAAYAVAQTASALLWGGLSDRIGRRPVLLAGLAACALALLLLPAADTFAALLAARVLHGVGSGTAGVMLAALVDTTPAHRRSRVLGRLGAATSAGAVLGPALVLALDRASPAAPEAAAAAVALLVLAAAWRGLPGARPVRLASAPAPATDAPRRVAALIACYAVAVGAASGVVAMLPGMSPALPAAWCIMYVGVAGAVLRTVAVAPLAARLGDARLLAVGLAVLGGGLAALALPFAPATTAGALTALALGTALTFPALGALLARAAAPARRGAVLGMQQASGGLARAAFPLLLGASLDAASPGVPLLGAGALLVLLAAAASVAAARAPVSAPRPGAGSAPPRPAVPMRRTAWPAPRTSAARRGARR